MTRGGSGCSSVCGSPQSPCTDPPPPTSSWLRAGRSSPGAAGGCSTTLTGAVNVDNVLLAAEAAVALEIDPDAIADALGSVSPVPGRLQVISSPGRTADADRPPFTVFVDYAHTPAGLEVVLGEARTLARSGRVLSVFGCGGHRDRAKRPLMGEVAVRLSDIAVLTSDNPRDEDPGAIIEDVLRGIPDGRNNNNLVVEPDRHLAIRRVLELARPGDVVVIAGKGHENYQEIAGVRLPFDDADRGAGAAGSPLWDGSLHLGCDRDVGGGRQLAARGLSPCSVCWSREESHSGSPFCSPPSSSVTSEGGRSDSTFARMVPPRTASRPAHRPWAASPSSPAASSGTPSATSAPRCGSPGPGTWSMGAVVAFGLIGYFDDYIKVHRRRSLGLNKRAKSGSPTRLRHRLRRAGGALGPHLDRALVHPG